MVRNYFSGCVFQYGIRIGRMREMVDNRDALSWYFEFISRISSFLWERNQSSFWVPLHHLKTHIEFPKMVYRIFWKVWSNLHPRNISLGVVLRGNVGRWRCWRKRKEWYYWKRMRGKVGGRQKGEDGLRCRWGCGKMWLGSWWGAESIPIITFKVSQNLWFR